MATINRVTRNAVKTVAKMPSDSVTAKPRIGPEPSQNITMPAISVVRLESIMVAKAREKPLSIAEIGCLPLRISSRIRS